MWEHQHAELKGFTKTYRVTRLVYHETYNRIDDAIAREKEIKGWRRSKKNALVETLNPRWNDLSAELFDAREVPPRPAAARDDSFFLKAAHFFLPKIVRLAAEQFFVRERLDLLRFHDDHVIGVLHFAFDDQKRFFRDDEADAFK